MDLSTDIPMKMKSDVTVNNNKINGFFYRYSHEIWNLMLLLIIINLMVIFYRYYHEIWNLMLLLTIINLMDFSTDIPMKYEIWCYC